MKLANSFSIVLACAAIVSPSLATVASAAPAAPAATTSAKAATPALPAQLKEQILASIAKGNAFLKSTQNPDGYWSQKEFPALTALALSAWANSPEHASGKPMPDYITKGYDYLLSQQKPDGGIYTKTLASYNTSISLMALLSANNPAWTPQILKARAFVVGQQSNFGGNNPFNGGIGYGGKDQPYEKSDLSNTTWALQALSASRHLVDDGKNGKQPDLDWDAAIQFVSRCQNSPETNDQAWAKNADKKDLGGFVYDPSSSKAQDAKNSAGTDPARVALRSYGSISYAGLQSLIYAKLTKEDPRVKAVMTWLAANFTLEENPGMGASGLFYYFQSMAKALKAAGIEDFTTPDGKTINWRAELAKKILALQKENGSWVNSDGRWWENSPDLVTAYMVLALEEIAH